MFGRFEHSPSAVKNINEELTKIFNSHNLDVDFTQTQPDLRNTYEWQFSTVVYMLAGLAIIIAIVGGLALMGTLSIAVIERTKEIGVLRAVGARSFTILGIFIMEGVLQGWISWLAAIPVSFIVSPIVASSLGIALFGAALDYQFNWGAVGSGWSSLVLFRSSPRSSRLEVQPESAFETAWLMHKQSRLKADSMHPTSGKTESNNNYVGTSKIINIQSVDKFYKTGSGDFRALAKIDLKINSGEFVSVIGKSGSGKSTLLNMITGIDRPSNGEVWVNGTAVHELSEGQMARSERPQPGNCISIFSTAADDLGHREYHAADGFLRTLFLKGTGETRPGASRTRGSG